MCRVVELTGDVTPDMRAIAQADLIVTTPEKWDGVSRSWQNRSYVQKVAILIIDEIHLLGKSPQQTCRSLYQWGDILEMVQFCRLDSPVIICNC